MLQGHGDIELLFDAVNKHGMLMMRKKYMKTIGQKDVPMYFYVDSAKKFAEQFGSGVSVLAEEGFYQHIPKSGLSFVTKMTMRIADRLHKVKMIQLQINVSS